MHSFERILSICKEDIEFELRGISHIPWADFLLNPRRLRGSDFLMRWSQGVWSEKRLIEAVNETGEFFAIPYGPSGTAPTNDVRAFELYFERLESAGLGKIKRPDLLIYNKKDESAVNTILHDLGGVEELPFIKEAELSGLLSLALIAVECENSLWKSKKMPAYNSVFSAQKRLGGKLGLKKTAVLPTVIVKEEDREPLNTWQANNPVKIHIWHVFYDQAFGIAFDEVNRLVNEGLIEPSVQVFQAPGGATTKKILYKIYYQYAYQLGVSVEEPKLLSQFVEDKNGHILPYVTFQGGKLSLADATKEILRKARK